jgi:hypothetical protein
MNFLLLSKTDAVGVERFPPEIYHDTKARFEEMFAQRNNLYSEGPMAPLKTMAHYDHFKSLTMADRNRFTTCWMVPGVPLPETFNMLPEKCMALMILGGPCTIGFFLRGTQKLAGTIHAEHGTVLYISEEIQRRFSHAITELYGRTIVIHQYYVPTPLPQRALL